MIAVMVVAVMMVATAAGIRVKLSSSGCHRTHVVAFRFYNAQ